MPEIIDTVFAKTSSKRSFSMTEYERFGLVYTKTRVYKFGHWASLLIFQRLLNPRGLSYVFFHKILDFFLLFTNVGQNYETFSSAVFFSIKIGRSGFSPVLSVLKP